MALGGAVLRIVATILRAIQLCCAIVACGVFAYFLAILADHSLPIATYIRAVTGMSGAAIFYTLFAVVLTICLAGVAFLSFIAIVLDILFAGCFAAIAYFTRDGAGSCSGNVNTPLGSGPSDSKSQGYGADGFGFGKSDNATYQPSLRRACTLTTAVFAVSIIAIFLFLITAVLQVLLVRHHKREKRYGPSPSNNYTSGAGRRPFWKRNRNKHATRDAEHATAPGVAGGYGRPSHETGLTDTTVVGGAPEPKYGQAGYGGGNANYYHGHGHGNAATNY